MSTGYTEKDNSARAYVEGASVREQRDEEPGETTGRADVYGRIAACERTCVGSRESLWYNKVWKQ